MNDLKLSTEEQVIFDTVRRDITDENILSCCYRSCGRKVIVNSTSYEYLVNGVLVLNEGYREWYLKNLEDMVNGDVLNQVFDILGKPSIASVLCKRFQSNAYILFVTYIEDIRKIEISSSSELVNYFIPAVVTVKKRDYHIFSIEPKLRFLHTILDKYDYDFVNNRIEDATREVLFEEISFIPKETLNSALDKLGRKDGYEVYQVIVRGEEVNLLILLDGVFD